MPTYSVTSPDGLKVSISGEAPPSESELDEIFGHVAKQKSLSAEKSSLQTQGKILGGITSLAGGAEQTVEGLTPSGLLNQPTRLAAALSGKAVPDQFQAGKPIVQLPQPSGTGVGAGLGKLASEFASGLTTPESVVTLPVATQSRLILALFGGQMAQELPEQVKTAVQVAQDPKATPADKVVAFGHPIVQTAMIAGIGMAKKAAEPSVEKPPVSGETLTMPKGAVPTPKAPLITPQQAEAGLREPSVGEGIDVVKLGKPAPKPAKAQTAITAASQPVGASEVTNPVQTPDVPLSQLVGKVARFNGIVGTIEIGDDGRPVLNKSDIQNGKWVNTRYELPGGDVLASDAGVEIYNKQPNPQKTTTPVAPSPAEIQPTQRGLSPEELPSALSDLADTMTALKQQIRASGFQPDPTAVKLIDAVHSVASMKQPPLSKAYGALEALPNVKRMVTGIIGRLESEGRHDETQPWYDKLDQIEQFESKYQDTVTNPEVTRGKAKTRDILPAKPTSLRPDQLKPALRVGESIVTGGDTHQQIADNAKTPEAQQALKDDKNHIFVDEQGNRYNRKQAAKLIGQKEPLHSEDLIAIREGKAQSTPPQPPIQPVLPPVAPSGATSEDFEVNPSKVSQFRSVAMKQGDKVIEGKPGDNHASIAERLGFPPDLIPGFVDKKGNFVYQYEEDVPKQTKPSTPAATAGESKPSPNVKEKPAFIGKGELPPKPPNVIPFARQAELRQRPDAHLIAIKISADGNNWLVKRYASRKALEHFLKKAGKWKAVVKTEVDKNMVIHPAFQVERAGVREPLGKSEQPPTTPPPTDTPEQVQPESYEERQKRVGPGLGAALSGEVEQKGKSITSTKNAQIEADRAARGKPSLIQSIKQSFGQWWDEAMRKIDNDPAYPQTLVESLEKNPRSPSPVENATLLYHLVGLKNDFYKLNDELAQAMDDAIQFPNREADVQELRLRKARLDDEIFRVEALTKKVGTEAGRALVARKMMANEDYELVQMRTNLRAAKGGKPLTPEESAEVNRLNQRIEELQKRLSDYESQKENRDSEAQATTTLSNIFKNRGRVEGKTIPKEKLIQQIKAKFDKNEGKDISGLVQKLARHYVGEGVVTRDALIDKIHGVLKLIDPDITRRDTMDAISGYGQYKQLAKDEISVVLRDLKGQMQQVGKLEDMAGGQAPQKTGIERRKPSQEERGLIKQVEEAKRKGGYDVTDPEKQLKSALDAVKTRLTNEIEDLEKQIATREKIVKNKTALQYDDAANQLKARRDELKRQFDEVFPKEPITDAQRLERWKAGIKKRMDDLQEKMDAGNYSKPERRPIVMDEAGLRLKAEYERVKNEFDRKVMAEKLKARTNYEKFSDAFSKWRRGFLLSSPVTLAKLTSAALERMIFTPIEEAMGAAYSKLPVIGKVAGQAPREGGISAKAEAKAITESLTTGMQDAYDVLRTGKSQLDNVFSKREVMPQELIDILGHIHGALKSPVKRAEFARSFQKRAEFAIRNGLDPSDPLVQTRLMAEAFKDAQRSIFMQDNRVVQAWETGLRLLESPDKLTGKTPVGRKAIATAGRFFLPIVKVPTNVVAETLQYATGLVTGSTRLAFAMRKGVENLSEDESDLIMRELKKGSLGGACLLLGYFNPTVFGGYYQSGEKKKQGQAAYGSVQIGGHNIPSFLVHNPLLETFQMGATIRRVADSKLRKKDTETQGIANGVIAGALGLTEEVPFVRQTADMVKILNPNDRQKYFNQIAKDAVIPLGVSWVAQHFDRDAKGNYIPRDPKTLFQSIETGIPGLRENVQKKVKK